MFKVFHIFISFGNLICYKRNDTNGKKYCNFITCLILFHRNEIKKRFCIYYNHKKIFFSSHFKEGAKKKENDSKAKKILFIPSNLTQA